MIQTEKMETRRSVMKKFERGFLLGAATAAHQVEGNNTNSDCWAMEQMEHTAYVEPSLDAVDHYNRYEEDIRLMAKAGTHIVSRLSGRGSSRKRAGLTRSRSSITAR